jgi:hypothetical protein
LCGFAAHIHPHTAEPHFITDRRLWRRRESIRRYKRRKKMRNSISKTMIASVTALTLGLAVAAPAFASDSTTSNSPGSRNAYNPLQPQAFSNDTQYGPAGTEPYHDNNVGSIYLPLPFFPQPQR